MANLNYNKVILGGRLTRDPEIKETQNGKKVASFSLAVSRLKEGADFINCNAWDKQAEFIGGYFHKGSNILIEGAIQTRKYTDKEGKERSATEVVVYNAHFVDSKADNEGTTPTATVNTTPMQGDYMAERYAQIGATAQATPQTVPMYEQLSDAEDLPF